MLAFKSRRQQKTKMLKREIAPAPHREWLQAQEDKVATFEEEFAEWTTGIRRFEEVATRKIYGNDKFHEIDIRFHRASLAGLIMDGESLAIEVTDLAVAGSVAPDYYQSYINLIDPHLSSLTKRLIEWHGNPADQADIPASLKNAMNEVAEGKVVEMDKALNEAPDSL
jgi:hypothetical protein